MNVSKNIYYLSARAWGGAGDTARGELLDQLACTGGRGRGGGGGGAARGLLSQHCCCCWRRMGSLLRTGLGFGRSATPPLGGRVRGGLAGDGLSFTLAHLPLLLLGSVEPGAALRPRGLAAPPPGVRARGQSRGLLRHLHYTSLLPLGGQTVQDGVQTLGLGSFGHRFGCCRCTIIWRNRIHRCVNGFICR